MTDTTTKEIPADLCSQVCDAEDHIANALNFAELVAMAHRFPECPEDRAVAAGALAITTALSEAQAILRQARGVAA